MLSYSEEKQRRIAQFTHYLKLMGLRARKAVKGNCFIIFEETPPEGADAGKLKESVAITADCLANGDSAARGGNVKDKRSARKRNESPRFIQLAFHRDRIILDLPKNTLFAAEANQILRNRPGFFYARNRTDLSWVRANLDSYREWNPLQKVYLYRDEESAAEDMAYIMFQIWNFPVDWQWYVTAAAFNSRRSFECGKRLD